MRGSQGQVFTGKTPAGRYFFEWPRILFNPEPAATTQTATLAVGSGLNDLA
jgi:hypothetical protein